MTSARPELRQRLLGEYASAPAGHNHDRLFHRLLAGHLVAVLGLGTVLWTADVPAAVSLAAGRVRSVTVRLGPEFSQPAPRPAEPPRRPEEIRPDTRLAQPRATDPPPDLSQAAPHSPETAGDDPPRRVYGVRRVFARGLGADGGGDGSLVVKRGNTLDGVADTLTATDRDLRAAGSGAASLSTVDQAPDPIHQVRPRYSPALLEHRVSGTVAARLLVQADGSVGTVEIVRDIGFDSAAVAAEALRQFRFRPAVRQGEPVAVYITFNIRFEFQE